MARMPQAQWLGERSPRNAMSRYDIVVVHTIVGFAPAHAAHFSVHQGGTIQQSRDTRYRSAANLDGNHRVIAIENEDHGSAFPSWSGSNVPALTDAQVEANAQILAWAHREHGVPLQLCPDSRSTSRGLAYHRQGIDGNFGPFKYGGRVSGGEQWSEHFGKVCPGDRRIDQIPAILARAKQIVNGDDDDMSAEAERKIDAIYEVLANGNTAQLTNPRTGDKVSVRYGVQEAWQTAEQLYDVLCNSNTAQMRRPGGGTASVRYGVERSWAGVEALKAMVAELATGPAADPDEFLDRVQARVEAGIADGVESEIPAVVTAVLEALGDRAGLDRDDVVAAVKTALREGADA